MTDQLTGKEDVQRILDYAESLAKESRKALTLEFNQKLSKLGEVRTSFIGESKKARFKLHADAIFTLAGATAESPSYLKELNVTVDKRAFTN